MPEHPISVHKAASRLEMGHKAAVDIATELRRRLAAQSEVRMIFAAAPSQSEMLAGLVAQSGIDWTRVIAFHMDEYLGLPSDAPQRFGLWLRRAIFNHLPFAAVHLIDPADERNPEPETMAEQYAAKLAEAPIDIVCLGIGVNGHLAFNDPPANLSDRAAVKIVQLDEICRRQQVDDGCFRRMEEVPLRAITLTIPRLLASDRLFCCVPGRSKREAVRRTFFDPIGPDCPATALRLHPNCAIYVDPDSAPEVY